MNTTETMTTTQARRALRNVTVTDAMIAWLDRNEGKDLILSAAAFRKAFKLTQAEASALIQLWNEHLI